MMRLVPFGKVGNGNGDGVVRKLTRTSSDTFSDIETLTQQTYTQHNLAE